MFFYKLRRGLLIAISMSLVFTIGVLAYGYKKRIPQINNLLDSFMGREEVFPLSLSPIEADIPKTTDKTLIKLERHYTACSHLLTEEHPIENRYAGRTEGELAAIFPNWQLRSFTSEKVVFRILIDGYCPDHFIIKEEGGYLVIFRPDKDTGIPLAVEATTVPLDRLSYDMQEKAAEGIVADSIEEVEQIMENLGS
ncbi:MAG: hypothetical protein GX854_08610 [Clostridiales bacterium]|nr:hypothetical protein [Clostridiales bacterium]